MADLQPLTAVHYNLSAVSSLGDVVAPPYDVIDSEQRSALLARSPFNVVELDLPQAREGGDPYEHAAETLDEWMLQAILVADRDPAIWALVQDYTGPDGASRTRRGLLVRVRVSEYGAGRVRPHERTQPGPKEDRLRLTRATRHNLSPIFALHPGDAWRHVEGATRGQPWGEATDADGTFNRVWRVGDAEVHRQVSAELAEAELLIADGHHRYETALTYADEVGGDGAHRYTLMSLTSLDDPGLTVFGTHRLLGGLADDSERQEALGSGIKQYFDFEEVPVEALDPAGEEGLGVFGYIDSRLRQAFRLRLKDPATLERAFPGVSDAYRTLDAAILEALILRGTLGMSADDIAAKRDLGYAKGVDEVLRLLDDADDYQAAFLLRPTPIEQVRAAAAAGETMPPKSTYFFPKLLTGLVFNPLS